MFEWLLGLMLILFIAAVVLAARYMAREAEISEQKQRRRRNPQT